MRWLIKVKEEDEEKALELLKNFNKQFNKRFNERIKSIQKIFLIKMPLIKAEVRKTDDGIEWIIPIVTSQFESFRKMLGKVFGGFFDPKWKDKTCETLKQLLKIEGIESEVKYVGD